VQKFTFDGPSKLFIAKPGVTSVDVQVDLYSDWKEEILLADNLKWLEAIRCIGGDPIGGGISAGATYFLRNGWKIRPQEADHQLTITGNLFLDEGETGGLLVPTLGDFTVMVVLARSNIIDTVATGGGDPGVIAGAVWDEPKTLHILPGSMGKEVTDTKSLATAIYQDVGDISDLATDLHSEAFGKWVVNPVANELTLYREDGSVLQVFQLTPTAATVPTYVARTPL